jgi:hypothetical protein
MPTTKTTTTMITEPIPLKAKNAPHAHGGELRAERKGVNDAWSEQ